MKTPYMEDANLTLHEELELAKWKLEVATREVAKLESVIEFKELEKKSMAHDKAVELEIEVEREARRH